MVIDDVGTLHIIKIVATDVSPKNLYLANTSPLATRPNKLETQSIVTQLFTLDKQLVQGQEPTASTARLRYVTGHTQPIDANMYAVNDDKYSIWEGSYFLFLCVYSDKFSPIQVVYQKDGKPLPSTVCSFRPPFSLVLLLHASPVVFPGFRGLGGGYLLHWRNKKVRVFKLTGSHSTIEKPISWHFWRPRARPHGGNQNLLKIFLKSY